MDLAVLRLQPEHFRLEPDPQVQSIVRLAEFGVEALEVSARVVLVVLAGETRVLEAVVERAEDAGDTLVPGELAEGVRVGQRDALHRVGIEPDQVAAKVRRHVGDAAHPRLHALARLHLPVPGRSGLAHHTAGDRDVLVVDVLDAERVDLLSHPLDHVHASLLGDVAMKVGIGSQGHSPPGVADHASR
jgi:hypothetical protein